MNEKIETAQTSYDEVPYGSHAFAQSHPDRLAVIGRLFGLKPAAVTRCRVLELGCASGGNLIPMAYHLPESEFIGVDLSSRQTEMGLKIIQDLGLKNIRIRHASILGLDDSWGKFDYIICHGVYSWVPKDVQDKILAVCSANLADTGIGYVSYNTYPGWHQREALRQMMLYHVRQMKESKHRIDQAKALIDFLARCVPSENNPYGMMLKNEMSLINRVDDWYLFHDHLEEVNDPVYFWQFAESMGRHGLQYLGEADFSTMLTSRLPKEVAETLKQINHNIISTEQYMDFFRNRQFRQTLLCHQRAPVRRNIGPPEVINLLTASAANTVDAEGKAVARTDLTSGISQSFRGPRGSITTNRPLTKAAMSVLRENWPRCLSMDALFNEAVQRLNNGRHAVQGDIQVLASDMLQAYTANAVEFRTWQGDFVTAVSEKPKISPLAAYQNRQGKSVVNLRHEQVPTDPLTQHIVNLSDGTRDRSEMVSHLTDMIKNGALTAHRDNQPITDVAMIQSNLEQDVNRRLAYLAGSALLIK